MLLAIPLVLVSLACAHERVQERNGCWVTRTESRWGDTRERVTACRPRAPRWSSDPFVRAIEDCLYQAQVASYDRAVRGATEPPSPADHTACLEHARELALSRIDHLNRELASSAAQSRRLENELRELRQTLVSCVEKSPTPTAFAEAHSTTESNSDSSSSEKRGTASRRGTGSRPAGRAIPVACDPH